MPLLHGALRLHDIADVEAFCTPIIPRHWNLTPHDRDDLLTYLIETAWELSLTYQPGGITFSTWAGTTLRRRTTDWLRTRNGRTTWRFATHTHTRELPVVISTDTELGAALTDSHVDGPEHRPADLAWLHRTRDSQAPPHHAPARSTPARRAA